MHLLFIGGDRRMRVAYDVLKDKYSVESLGLFPGDGGDITAADAVIFPLPATKDGKTVYCPLTNAEIPLEIVRSSKRGTHILSGGYDFSRYPQTDYSALDGFCIKNAVATAEGAIAFAVNNTDITLFDSRILITGFGRVGKILLSRLSGFRADICVSARNDADLSYLEALGVGRIETAAVEREANGFDIIFNTLDICLFSAGSYPQKPYIFDLSSKGCISCEGNAPANYFKLPGIPGKTAPKSAGILIADTVDKILKSTAKQTI